MLEAMGLWKPARRVVAEFRTETDIIDRHPHINARRV